MPDEHARLSPSAAVRWASCPSAPNLEAHFPDEQSSDAAEKGTAAHWVLERCLLDDNPAEHYLDRIAGNGLDVTQEMVDIVDSTLTYIYSYILDNPETEIIPEGKLPSGDAFGRKDCWGTGDVLLLNRILRLMIVLDLKAGRRDVSPIDNMQCELYALGALQLYPDQFDEVLMVISQPLSGGHKEHLVTSDHLRSRLPFYRRAAIATDKATQADAVPSQEACMYCKANPCEKSLEFSAEMAARDFDQVEKDFPKADPEAKGKLLTDLCLLEDIIAKLKSSALEDLKLGIDIPGWKAVAGRSTRSWLCPEDTTAFLEAAGIPTDLSSPRTLVTPAKAEKLPGVTKADLKDFVRSQTGSPTLAPASDRRKAIEPDF